MFIWHCLFLVLLPALQAGELTPVEEPFNYDCGVQIIKEKGVEAGVKYFERHAAEKNTLASLFGMAWAYWKDGAYEQSGKLCRYILAREPIPNLAANCHYLLGHLNFNAGMLDEAELSFQKALGIYEKVQSETDIRQTLMGLTVVHLAERNLAEAERVLAQIEVDSGQTQSPDGFIFEIRNRLAFARGEYNRALAFARQSEAAYATEGDRVSEIYAKGNVGFLLVIQGQVGEAMATLDEVDAFAKAYNDKKLSYYNGVSWILFYRLLGYEYLSLVPQVEAWIAAFNDQYLADHLNFALSWDKTRND